MLMKIACVTGAMGMIGRRIVRRLLSEGYKVRALDLRVDFDDPSIDPFQGDIGDLQLLMAFLKDADLVFHCAAELRDETKMWDVNVSATEKLVELIEDSKVQYFCHLSSAGVIGRTNIQWVDEETECNPQNMYERSKWAAEQQAARKIEGCRVVILRPTNVVDYMRTGSLHLPVDRSILERLKVFVKGGESAHIVHAENVAEAALFFVSQPVKSLDRYFVSCDHEPLNTYAGIWALFRAFQDGQTGDGVRPVPHLPLIVPHVLRRLWRRTGNRGDVFYSSKKLLSKGFNYPIDFQATVRNLVHGPE